MGKKTCNGLMSRRITVVRRTTISSQSDSAEPVTTYADVFSVRANIKTNGGVNEWSRVRVGDLDATHTFTIRHHDDCIRRLATVSRMASATSTRF